MGYSLNDLVRYTYRDNKNHKGNDMCTNVHTFDYLLDFYITDRVPAEATIKHFKFVINLFQKDTGISDVREMDKLVVLKWRNNVLDRASASTCNNYIRHMKSLFNCAHENELVENNPFAKVGSVAVSKKTHRSTSRDHVAQALDFLNTESHSFDPHWFWIAVIRTLYFTGMRRRQLVELRWKDVQFEKRLIKLRAESSKNKREWNIPLNEQFLNDLIHLKKVTWDMLGVDVNLDDLQVFNITLFNKRFRGEKMTVSQVSGFFKRMSKKLGFKLSTHRFRHRLASELVNKKDDIKVVQELLGHTNILTTYGYVKTDMKKMRSLVSEINPV